MKKETLRVRWYSKGKLSDEENIPIIVKPYLKIVKYEYDDRYSYNGCRFWVMDVDNLTILDNPHNQSFSHTRVIDEKITEKEFKLVKDDTITLTNNKVSGACTHFKWSELMQHFSEEEFYI